MTNRSPEPAGDRRQRSAKRGKPDQARPETVAAAVPQISVSSSGGPAPAVRGKTGLLIGLLKQPAGASIEEMMQASGWQAHSVRGALSGAISKRLGLRVTSAVTEAGGRRYRIEPADAGR